MKDKNLKNLILEQNNIIKLLNRNKEKISYEIKNYNVSSFNRSKRFWREIGIYNPRLLNVLSVNEIYNLKELKKYTEEDLLKLRNFGENSLEELKKVLIENTVKF
tara:strand:- start:251 stop:565 length:315 start_codon:yes stop_codon:yes gene_type:complete